MTFLTTIAIFPQPRAGLLWDDASLAPLGLSRKIIHAPAAVAGERVTIALAATAENNPKPVRVGATRFTGPPDAADTNGLDLGDFDPAAFVARVEGEWNEFLLLALEVIASLAPKTTWSGKFVEMFQLGIDGKVRVFHLGLGSANTEVAEDTDGNRLFPVHAYVLAHGDWGNGSVDLLPSCTGAKSVKKLSLFRRGDTSPMGLPADVVPFAVSKLPGGKSEGVLDGVTAREDALPVEPGDGEDDSDSVVRLFPPDGED